MSWSRAEAHSVTLEKKLFRHFSKLWSHFALRCRVAVLTLVAKKILGIHLPQIPMRTINTLINLHSMFIFYNMTAQLHTILADLPAPGFEPLTI